ncbi:hypothetical protein V8G54_026145 [Vigna mungo]|uniref:Uncharacterized protein n=1 Tax=Vigna mungo TaxID=3915 RepID=A0AAQ3RQ86_VIGMU
MKSGRTWNWTSFSFWPSESVLRKPGGSSEKAPSSGARMVKPPDLMVMSWELSWLMSCVVFMRRRKMLKELVCVRIDAMSVAPGLLSVGGGWGSVGVKGFVGAEAGAVVGDRAVRAVACKREKRSAMGKGECFVILEKLRLWGC